MKEKLKNYILDMTDGLLIDNNLVSISLLHESIFEAKYILKFKDAESIDMYLKNNHQLSITENQVSLSEQDFLNYMDYIFIYKKAKLREEKINQILEDE